ncbi:hypothetical protein IQ268_15215 [Oculatella sp. LEGE 06141]|uniref:hypothetical protein n=1 Tax=Oculatella sp. LEGE 06141 TaxID=1828648 RepID=UPI0018813DFD|nr:hypothetical protein [Oculatella sp. LEGE 06141]MBE9179920.1 hypothetical protein [Oculatella sp. LEGE 06141]
MRTEQLIVSACRHCQFFEGEGRRGGQCQQLGVPVQGGWKACSLAIAPFAPTWETLREAVTLKQKTLPSQELPLQELQPLRSSISTERIVERIVEKSHIPSAQLAIPSRLATASGMLDE